MLYSGYYSYRHKKKLDKYIIDLEWNNRIEDTVSCNDNMYIDRIEDAGKIIKNFQFLHNGIKIKIGSYYGYGYSHLLKINKGVHEPQEERVFQEVLKYIPSGGVMLELGSFWSFYSIWFQKQVLNGVNYMIEPDYLSLLKGKINFRINGFQGNFTNASISHTSIKNQPIPVITVDDFLKKNRIKKLNILHSDIQAEEYNMLKGSINSFDAGLIDFVFISTHSNDLHKKCIKFLSDKKYEIIADIDLYKTFSVDGLIVAKNSNIQGPSFLKLDYKK